MRQTDRQTDRWRAIFNGSLWGGYNKYAINMQLTLLLLISVTHMMINYHKITRYFMSPMRLYRHDVKVVVDCQRMTNSIYFITTY